MPIRLLLMVLFMLVVLAFANYQIFLKENLLAQSQPIFLELAPRDPRSLIQGDYMALNYSLARSISQANIESEGWLAITLDENRIARSARSLETPSPLSANELRLRVRRRGDGIRIGPDAFFFEEGDFPIYRSASYAELRVNNTGESMLVQLRGRNLEPLGNPALGIPRQK